ncbi:hypothetical protein [Paenibacillus sp. DMB20]|uniref:hypothetical protein n=1 Tax=Paenibacillus sp. DMB20 TaxID=1642570 RepID=UPI000627AF4F|nr:hypothetical protein [Paenibacillus sp. DMB20]KKO52346.1 hypothetical protein XI25_19275 [Paenibacillus sp. DMB20]
MKHSKKPDLYLVLLNKYSDDGHIPEHLENILVRDYNITSNASREASRKFIESALFAKIIDSNREFILNSKVDDEEKVEESETTIYVPDKSKSTDDNVVDMIPYRGDVSPSIYNSDERKQTFNFALTDGKFAQLVVPVGLKSKDILIISKQIELLELQVEEA